MQKEETNNEELKRNLLESFDIEESFLILGMKLKNLLRFQVAVLFEIDWKTLVLVPTALFPSARKNLLTLKSREIPVGTFLYDFFSSPWLEMDRGKGSPLGITELPSGFPSLFYLFPLKVKQRIMCAVGIGGIQKASVESLERVSHLLGTTAPYLEKNLIIDKTIRKNQRLETILGCGSASFIVIDRAGYVVDYIPDQKNFLGYSQEELARRSVTEIMGGGDRIIKKIWKDVFKGYKNFHLLVNTSCEKKNLTSISVKKTLLKYNLQKEYYLLRIEPVEDELTRRFSSPLEDKTSSLHLKVTFCPENLSCMKKLGRKAHYIGEGTFHIGKEDYKRERCTSKTACITESLPVGYQSHIKLFR